MCMISWCPSTWLLSPLTPNHCVLVWSKRATVQPHNVYWIHYSNVLVPFCTSFVNFSWSGKLFVRNLASLAFWLHVVASKNYFNIWNCEIYKVRWGLTVESSISSTFLSGKKWIWEKVMFKHSTWFVDTIFQLVYLFDFEKLSALLKWLILLPLPILIKYTSCGNFLIYHQKLWEWDKCNKVKCF
jgi:hypothetical protein